VREEGGFPPPFLDFMKQNSIASHRIANLLLAAAAGACLAATGGTALAQKPASPLESIEWCDIWISHANETNLPRVLLIGDSISKGYYPEVEKRLARKTYVGRLSSSRFVSDPVLLKEITLVLDEFEFDVIYFNNGMHGWHHSEMEYQKAFPKFLKAIQSHAKGAKLIWATTTPLKESPALPPGDKTTASDERIAARNAIAQKLVQAKGIPVDDLNAVVRGHPEYYNGNVHFNSQGIALEAAEVAAHIELVLPNQY
jgi:lysophospholipase L1-like esterase